MTLLKTIQIRTAKNIKPYLADENIAFKIPFNYYKIKVKIVFNLISFVKMPDKILAEKLFL